MFTYIYVPQSYTSGIIKLFSVTTNYSDVGVQKK